MQNGPVLSTAFFIGVNVLRVSDKQFKKIRTEFNSPQFRKSMEQELGCTCVNCGSSKYIEYHHIVPVIYGGTNKLSNIVPLCLDCHYKAHQKANAEGIKKAKAEGRCGRSKIASYEEAKPVLKRYFDLEIGNKELHGILGFSPNNHSGTYLFKQKYRKEFKIPKTFRNNIDILEAAPNRIYNEKTGRPSKEKYMYQGGMAK
jgi:hypothetical protein